MFSWSQGNSTFERSVRPEPVAFESRGMLTWLKQHDAEEVKGPYVGLPPALERMKKRARARKSAALLPVLPPARQIVGFVVAGNSGR